MGRGGGGIGEIGRGYDQRRVLDREKRRQSCIIHIGGGGDSIGERKGGKVSR